jgi:flavin reductase (DIM6/NTAB) family NADH-FMN oxidoreductase RutF
MSGTVDDIVARTDTALVVVTTASPGQRAGCLVGFHTQCSIEPFRYAVWLSKANYTYRVALFATHFAVHFLGDDDQELAEHFGTQTGDDVDKFSGRDWSPGEGGVPVLAGCATVVFEKATLWDDGGDHVCLVGTPVAVASAESFTPLRLSAAEHLDAGHDVEERPVPDVGGPGASGDVDDLQQVAAGFGHELTPDQVAALSDEHESGDDGRR